ncbi:MAG TPA: septal ring lytic transglycosylase RlpA family protein [Solirubrobacteraceae bacterium]|nr:septal ring lytic transglycosylase RlpA family protein [Solirubrobacteraceae bacterium]
MTAVPTPVRRATAAAGLICFAAMATAVTSNATAGADDRTAARTDATAGPSVVRTGGRTTVLAGRRAWVHGELRPATRGRVVLQRRGERGWTTVARTTTALRGRFRIAFRPPRPGSSRLRLIVRGADGRAMARRGAGRLTVFRRAQASWYGPGLFGNRLGCGGTLAPGTLGVAHRTLPCGTRVTLRHHGRMVRVPVVDRGPYAGNREFDLTAATRARLGFSGTGAVLVDR